MTKLEIANDYLKKGYYTNMTAEQIKSEISKLESEILRVDKRTYNGKMTRIFNNSRINIAKIILEVI